MYLICGTHKIQEKKRHPSKGYFNVSEKCEINKMQTRDRDTLLKYNRYQYRKYVQDDLEKESNNLETKLKIV